MSLATRDFIRCRGISFRLPPEVIQMDLNNLHSSPELLTVLDTGVVPTLQQIRNVVGNTKSRAFAGQRDWATAHAFLQSQAVRDSKRLIYYKPHFDVQLRPEPKRADQVPLHPMPRGDNMAAGCTEDTLRDYFVVIIATEDGLRDLAKFGPTNGVCLDSKWRFLVYLGILYTVLLTFDDEGNSRLVAIQITNMYVPWCLTTSRR